MLRRLTFLFATVLLGVAGAQATRPKLVLALTVDQFRYDYLTRYRGEYNSGFAKLLTRGAVFTNAFYEHSPTITAIGHSTILSGASPVMSGIVANEWYDRETGKQVSSVSDPERKTVGAAGREAASPHRLLVSSIGDQIKIGNKGESKVIGISVKDRSAILPAGRMADAAYWFDAESGGFISSTWYMEALPSWAEKFNSMRPAEKYLNVEWIPVAGGKPLTKMSPNADAKFYSKLEASPFGNEIVEQFTEAAVENEKLGAHAGIDLLAVSFSSNDYVGHAVGPDSPEAHDMAVRTDRLFGKLFAYLDRKVGMSNVVVVFTADHGVAPLPELSAERKMPGGRLSDKQISGAVEAALSAQFGEGQWIVSRSPEQIYLNWPLIAERKADAVKVRAAAAEVIRNQPHIFRVYTRDMLMHAQQGNDLVGRRAYNGFFAPRGPDLVVIPEPFWIFSNAKSGTTHSTPFQYDAHVPLVIMGPGIRPGRYHRAAAVNDIAPTLAALLEIDVPSGSMGRVLDEALTN